MEEPEYKRIDLDALARSWDQNPLKDVGMTPLVAIYEGSNVLLSALAEIAPQFVLDPEETDLPTMMKAVYDARQQWFPNGDEWMQNTYGVMKEVLREHEIDIASVTVEAALAWMGRSGLKTATAAEIKTALSHSESS